MPDLEDRSRRDPTARGQLFSIFSIESLRLGLSLGIRRPGNLTTLYNTPSAGHFRKSFMSRSASAGSRFRLSLFSIKPSFSVAFVKRTGFLRGLLYYVIPLFFLVTFLTSCTIVLVYTFALKHRLPSLLVIGLAIVFGAIAVVALVTWLCLWFLNGRGTKRGKYGLVNNAVTQRRDREDIERGGELSSCALDKFDKENRACVEGDNRLRGKGGSCIGNDAQRAKSVDQEPDNERNSESKRTKTRNCQCQEKTSNSNCSQQDIQQERSKLLIKYPKTAENLAPRPLFDGVIGHVQRPRLVSVPRRPSCVACPSPASRSLPKEEKSFRKADLPSPVLEQVPGKVQRAADSSQHQLQLSNQSNDQSERTVPSCPSQQTLRPVSNLEKHRISLRPDCDPRGPFPILRQQQQHSGEMIPKIQNQSLQAAPRSHPLNLQEHPNLNSPQVARRPTPFARRATRPRFRSHSHPHDQTVFTRASHGHHFPHRCRRRSLKGILPKLSLKIPRRSSLSPALPSRITPFPLPLSLPLTSHQHQNRLPIFQQNIFHGSFPLLHGSHDAPHRHQVQKQHQQRPLQNPRLAALAAQGGSASGQYDQGSETSRRESFELEATSPRTVIARNVLPMRHENAPQHAEETPTTGNNQRGEGRAGSIACPLLQKPIPPQTQTQSGRTL